MTSQIVLLALVLWVLCTVRCTAAEAGKPHRPRRPGFLVPPKQGDDVTGIHRESALVGANAKQEVDLCNSQDWNNYFRNFKGLEKFLDTDCALAGECCVDDCCVAVVEDDEEFNGTVFNVHAFMQCGGATCTSRLYWDSVTSDRMLLFSSLDLRNDGCGVLIDSAPNECSFLEFDECSPVGLRIDQIRNNRSFTAIVESAFEATCELVTPTPVPAESTPPPNPSPTQEPRGSTAPTTPAPTPQQTPNQSQPPIPRPTEAIPGEFSPSPSGASPTSSEPTVFDCVATMRAYANSSSLLQHMERSMGTVRRQTRVRSGTLLCVVLGHDGREVCATGNHLFKYGERYVTALELCAEEGWQCYTVTERYTGVKWNVGREGYYTLDGDRDLHLTPYSSHTGRWMQGAIEPRSQWLWDLLTI